MTSPEPKKTAPISRPASAASKVHTRGNSFASSTISRSGSTASRPNANNFSATMGYGSRGASGMPRPQTSLGTRRTNNSIQRPATSLDTHDEDSAGSVLGKRKGTQFSLSVSSSYSGPSGPPKSRSRGVRSPRSASVAARPVGVESFKDHMTSSSTTMMMQKQPNDSSNLTTPIKPLSMTGIPRMSPPKPFSTPRSPTGRTPKRPPIPLFLTKESTLTNPNHNSDTEWNQESREKHMDEMFQAFMSRMNQQGHETSGLKDTVEVYKSRSR